MNPRVKAVRPAPEYTLILTFTNGEVRCFDAKPYLDVGFFRELREPGAFASVRACLGSIQWQGGQDLCPDVWFPRRLDQLLNQVYGPRMVQINIHEAKTHLSRLARRIKQGETVVLCDRNKPFAEIRPLPQTTPLPSGGRPLGLYAGQVTMSPDFDSPETNRQLAALFQKTVRTP